MLEEGKAGERVSTSGRTCPGIQFHSSDTWIEYLVGEIEAMKRMGPSAGPHFYQGCLDMYTSYPPFQPNLCQDLEKGVGRLSLDSL